ncbi:MAG: hypothetical protein Q8L88_00320 [Bacteroidota bacterium]|nr:hypothetical protein [Bacteroidota bacterium]
MKRVLFFAVVLFSYLEAQVDSSIVATVASYHISSDDLLTSFEFGPAFVKRRRDPVREHLKYMVYERLLALEAEQNGLKSVEFVNDRIHALEEDGAVEQLYRQDILSQVKLSDEQISNDTRKAKITISLRWIYKPTKLGAEQIEKMINAGAKFDSLFSLQFDSTVNVDGRSLETTLLKLERDNEELSKIISTLKVGKISTPIPQKDGFYIFHLDKAEQNPITTESEFAELKNQAIEIRTKLIAEGLADQYVKNMMKPNNPIIKADGFNILRAYLADKGLSRDTKVKWDIPSTFMTEAGPQPIRNSGNYLNRPLVTFGGRTITIREYAQWYDIRQFQFDTRSLEAFNSSVKKTIWKMVQDRLLSEEAYKRGLERLPFVANETKKWESKLLYLSQRAALVRTIDASDSVLNKYYNQHKSGYKNAQGKQMKFIDVRESVKGDFFSREESLLLLKTIEALQKKYPVMINESELKRLSKKISSDSQAIETVFYKPGGTFPRVAFPTIDEAWSKVQ